MEFLKRDDLIEKVGKLRFNKIMIKYFLWFMKDMSYI